MTISHSFSLAQSLFSNGLIPKEPTHYYVSYIRVRYSAPMLCVKKISLVFDSFDTVCDEGHWKHETGFQVHNFRLNVGSFFSSFFLYRSETNNLIRFCLVFLVDKKR